MRGGTVRASRLGSDDLPHAELNWSGENSPAPATPVFTAQSRTTAISTDAVSARLRLHTQTARRSCPSLARKDIAPHTLRHTTAMRMLEAGIDITTIALWLGHESTSSTEAYLHADLGIKQRALQRLAPPPSHQAPRYKPDDRLLTFLESL